MSGPYYNNQQGYGNHHYHHESSEPPQYLHQNYGYNQNQGFVPPYQNNPGFVVTSEEYLRQPATSPYATAPAMPMPESVPPIVRMTEPTPAPNQEPRVIIVQHPPARDEDCCRVMCRCIDWLLTRICYVILSLILIAVLIGLAIWLINKYRRH